MRSFLIYLFNHLLLVILSSVLVTVQKRSLPWPQDLDGVTRVVELYIVNDFKQVCVVHYHRRRHRHLKTKFSSLPATN